jgi:hypothetical protein
MPHRLVSLNTLREIISTFPHICVNLCSCVVFFFVVSLAAVNGQTNSTNQPSPGARAEQIRTACVEGRRYVCGKVLQVTADGLVVDSGYPDLLNPPFNKSWVVRGTASISRPPQLLEQNAPDAICVGLVFLTGIPKKPEVHEYDYVVLHAYPAGQYQYKPVPGVEKTVRRFSGSLELAVKLNSQN